MAMIRLVPPEDVCRQYLIPGGEPLEEHRITLVYLGESADLRPSFLDDAHSVLAPLSEIAWPELVGRVNGFGVFHNGEGQDALTALWMAWDVPVLDIYRVALVQALTRAGLLPPPADTERHGFTPHQTIQYRRGMPHPAEALYPYLPSGAGEPTSALHQVRRMRIPSRWVTFDQVELWHEGRRLAYPIRCQPASLLSRADTL